MWRGGATDKKEASSRKDDKSVAPISLLAHRQAQFTEPGRGTYMEGNAYAARENTGA